jgi:hypothetical protein
MLKHIGRHGDRKVALLWREVPGEDHMCLVVYPETLPTHIHNSLMATLESAPGQAAPNLADVLHRNYLPDGRVQLTALHQEGMIKKIPTNQVIVTPNSQSSVKLDELNRILKEMETGESARQRMKEIDDSTGIVDPATKRKAEAEFRRQQERQPQAPIPPVATTPDGVLDDKALAMSMLTQALRMQEEAEGMIKEAARMKKEAQRMHPGVIPGEPAKADPTIPAKSTRGRPKKVVAENAVE